MSARCATHAHSRVPTWTPECVQAAVRVCRARCVRGAACVRHRSSHARWGRCHERPWWLLVQGQCCHVRLSIHPAPEQQHSTPGSAPVPWFSEAGASSSCVGMWHSRATPGVRWNIPDKDESAGGGVGSLLPSARPARWLPSWQEKVLLVPRTPKRGTFAQCGEKEEEEKGGERRLQTGTRTVMALLNKGYGIPLRQLSGAVSAGGDLGYPSEPSLP